MLKLIVGRKGTGKTKQLISMVNEAVEVSSGKVVCIEKGRKLIYDINHGARLLNTDHYSVTGHEAFYGFLAGIAASDFDVKEIFVDSLLKIVGGDVASLSAILEKINNLSKNEEINFVITLSMEENDIQEYLIKFVI